MASETKLKPPAGCAAALFFLDGQLLFQHDGGGALKSKFISPAAARQAFAGEPIDSGWLPGGVNRWGTGARGVWMVRWHAPAVYTLRREGKSAPQRLRVPMPALIWFGQRHNYYIWAMKGETFNPANLLYRAPLANVNHRGLICFGQNAHPDVSKGFAATWRTFWDAPFNDDHRNGKSHAHKDNINTHLLKLAKAKAAQYPAKDLIEQGGNLDAMIAKLTRRGDDHYIDAPGWDGDDD